MEKKKKKKDFKAPHRDGHEYERLVNKLVGDPVVSKCDDQNREIIFAKPVPENYPGQCSDPMCFVSTPLNTVGLWESLRREWMWPCLEKSLLIPFWGGIDNPKAVRNE